MLALGNEGSLAASLAAGVDGFLGNDDIDLVGRVTQIQSLQGHFGICLEDIRKAGTARRGHLADRFDLHKHPRPDDLIENAPVLIIALIEYGLDRIVNRLSVFFAYSSNDQISSRSVRLSKRRHASKSKSLSFIYYLQPRGAPPRNGEAGRRYVASRPR
jgi:hypothetical protein